MKAVSLGLLVVIIGPSISHAQAIREGHFSSSALPQVTLPQVRVPQVQLPSSGYSSGSVTSELNDYLSQSIILPPPAYPPDTPVLQEASPYPPCAFCTRGLDPNDNPGEDLPRYEEMNTEVDPIPPFMAVPEAAD